MSEVLIYTSMGTLCLALIGALIKLTWQVSRVEREVREDLNAQVDNVQRDIVKLERDCISRTESLTHQTGEMGNALRTKIHEVEVWSRDTYVRKDSFELVIGRLEKSIEKMTDKLEDKIDRAIERIRPS